MLISLEGVKEFDKITEFLNKNNISCIGCDSSDGVLECSAYSCKVACMVSWQPAFTLDKIYTVKNGEIIDNNGVAWGLETKIKSLKDLNSLCGAKFIEIEN